MQAAEDTLAWHPFGPQCGRPGTAYFFTGGPYPPGCGPLLDPTTHDTQEHP